MKLKFTWIPFILAVITGVSIRVMQILNGSYTITSFLCNMQNPSFVLALVLGVFVLIIIIMSALCKNEPDIEIIRRNIFGAICLLITGMIMIIKGTYDAIRFFVNGAEITSIILGITAILGGIVFIVMSCCHFVGKNLFESAKVLALFPTLWGCVSLMIMFFNHSSVSVSNIDKFDFLFMMAITLFMFSQAKLIAHFETEKTQRFFWAFSMAVVLIVVVYTIPTLTALVLQEKVSNVMDVIEYIMQIFFAGYVFAIMLSVYKDPTLAFSKKRGAHYVR